MTEFTRSYHTKGGSNSNVNNNVRERMEAAPVSSLNKRSLFLETFLHRQRTYLDDVLDRDADADDDYDYDESLLDYYSQLVDDQVVLKSPTTSINNNETYSTNVNFTNSTNNPISSFANYTKCAWYTLSHYIPPDSMLYDGIEGFLIALLLCLVLATCYNYCCYCYCCCAPGKKNLRKRRRRRKVKLKKEAERKRNGGCCGCLSTGFGSSSSRRKDRDGKGAFTLLRTANGSKNSDYVEDDDDSSVSSIDSVLSLEYGDTHLHNEYGEITSRWDDSKIEAAARDYFAKEEKEASAKKSNGKKSGSPSDKGKAGKKKGSSRRRNPSGSSRGRKRSRKLKKKSAAMSRSSSILSSSSDLSLSSFASSSSGSQDGLEMEAAMMDLELVKRSIAEKGYV